MFDGAFHALGKHQKMVPKPCGGRTIPGVLNRPCYIILFVLDFAPVTWQFHQTVSPPGASRQHELIHVYKTPCCISTYDYAERALRIWELESETGAVTKNVIDWAS